MYKQKISKLELDELMKLRRMVNACLFHLHAIEDSEDPEIIEVHICALEAIHGDGTIRTDIRNGQGDLRKIQEKCIRLGLV